MSGFELNKIFSSILLAILITLIVGNISRTIYYPQYPKQRGYEVAVSEESNSSIAKVEEIKINIPELMAQAIAETGQNLTKKCISCHTFEKGGMHKIGPNLWGVFKSNKAKKDGYKYSDALVAKGGQWTEEELFSFLRSPKTFVPGTKMLFPGFDKPQDIANVIAFLKLHKD